MSSAEFIIQNNNCGKYIHPEHQHPSVPDNDPLVLLDDRSSSNTHFVFEKNDAKWGYIRHTKSNKVWHPLMGASFAKTNGTKICLHSDRARHALFTFDEATKQIQHIDGLYVHYNSGRETNPQDGDNIVLYDGQHEGTKWDRL
ncbi:unnamed protein product, partial [Meganyctiphanes norvegica]